MRVGTTHSHALAAAPERGGARDLDGEREALLGLARWASLALAPRPAIELPIHALLVDVTGTALVHESEERLLGGGASGPPRPRPRSARGDRRRPSRRPGARARGEGVDRPPRRDAVSPSLALAAPGARARARGAHDPRRGFGIETVGQLLSLPGASFLRASARPWSSASRARSASDPAELAVPARCPEETCERIELEGGTDRPEDLASALELLATRTLERLADRGARARALRLIFTREDAPRASFPLSARRADLDDPGPAGPSSASSSSASTSGTSSSRSSSACPRPPGGASARAVLLGARARGRGPGLPLARLETRLGPRPSSGPTISDHRPERAYVYVPAASSPRNVKLVLASGPAPDEAPRPPLPDHGAELRLGLAGEPLAARERPPRRELDRPRARRDGLLGRESGPPRLLDRRLRRQRPASRAELSIVQDLDTGAWFWHGIYD